MAIASRQILDETPASPRLSNEPLSTRPSRFICGRIYAARCQRNRYGTEPRDWDAGRDRHWDGFLFGQPVVYTGTGFSSSVRGRSTMAGASRRYNSFILFLRESQGCPSFLGLGRACSVAGYGRLRAHTISAVTLLTLTPRTVYSNCVPARLRLRPQLACEGVHGGAQIFVVGEFTFDRCDPVDDCCVIAIECFADRW
jgi:hypothetical protein